MVSTQNNRRNNEYKEIENVTFHFGDRDDHLEFAKLLSYISKKVGIVEGGDKKWDLVIDFCAYLRKEVKSVIRGLSKRLELYVLISSDSIYDVCDEKIREGPPKETDDIRPHSEKEIQKLADDEDYGHDKLRCEEYLRSHVADIKEGFPFVCLRLPDVIGPYDSTGRLYAYFLWLKEQALKPIHT